MDEKPHSPDYRLHLVLRLIGGDDPAGEIPLDRMAQVADATQELVVRLARGLSGRSGAGRTPGALAADLRLNLVSIGPGSTMLDIAGPPLEAELDLGGDVDPPAAVQALELLSRALKGTARDDVPLPLLSRPAAESLDRWLSAFQPYEEIAATVGRGTEKQEVRLAPQSARQTLHRKVNPPSDRVDEKVVRRVEGELYAVNLHSGRFRVEDDLGHSIQLVVPGDLATGAGRLLGNRIRAVGQVDLDEVGAIRELTVNAIDAAPEDDSLPESLDREAELEDRLEQAAAIAPADLAMDDLEDEEAEAFWRAIEEARG